MRRVLAPHTDDGELGCGTSIARFVEEGADVFYAAFSTADQSLPEGDTGIHHKYHHEELGINSRLDAMQAGILRVKLRHVDQWMEYKRALAAAYDKELSAIDRLQVPYVIQGCRHTYDQYTIKVPADLTRRAEA